MKDSVYDFIEAIKRLYPQKTPLTYRDNGYCINIMSCDGDLLATISKSLLNKEDMDELLNV